MIHSQTKRQIVRKTISGINKELYCRLIHIQHENMVQILGLEDPAPDCYTYEEYIPGKTLCRSVQELERLLGMHGFRRFLWNIPGFRTGKQWKKIIASILYVYAAISVVSVMIVDGMAGISFFLALHIPPYMLIANPLKIRRKLPMINSEFAGTKIWGIVLY